MLLAIAILLFQSIAPSHPAEKTPSAPQAVVVKKLYHEVVGRRPLGIPKGVDLAAIQPYLSDKLIHELQTAQACEADYFRHHHNPDEKPEFEWLEAGLFSGWNEQSNLSAASVIRGEFQDDGSFEVSVRFRAVDAHMKPWYASVVVLSQNGRYVVDDVVLYPDGEPAWFLSKAFVGCNGDHWVGEKN